MESKYRKCIEHILSNAYDVWSCMDIEESKEVFNKYAYTYNSLLEKQYFDKCTLKDMEKEVANDPIYCFFIGVENYNSLENEINRIRYFSLKLLCDWPEEIESYKYSLPELPFNIYSAKNYLKKKNIFIYNLKEKKIKEKNSYPLFMLK